MELFIFVAGEGGEGVDEREKEVYMKEIVEDCDGRG